MLDFFVCLYLTGHSISIYIGRVTGSNPVAVTDKAFQR